MNSDNKELNAILKKGDQAKPNKNRPPASPTYIEDDDEFSDDVTKAYVQWTTHNGKVFVPASKTKVKLTPGVYEIDSNPQIGLFFEKIPVKVEGLLRFPDTNSESVVEEIQKFWNLEDKFKEFGLPYKRGILLWGPPGSGKSCTLQLIMADVVKRGGVVVKFDDPYLFIDGMRTLRTIQPDTPVVVILEDIDSIIEVYNESEVLNILDGVNEVNKMVFLATTNYPGKLGTRIVNRPSRFDKRFKIGMPTAKSRKMYFESLFGQGKVTAGRKKIKEMGVNLKRWVEDTKEMSLAHMKELFTAVVFLGDKYEDAVDTLKTMMDDVEKEDREDEGHHFGFSAKIEPDKDSDVDWSEEEEDDDEGEE